MPAARSGPDWSILIAGSALAITFAGGLWTLVNPQRDTERLEKRVAVLEDSLTWKYVSKELLLKDMSYIDRSLITLKTEKIDKDVYEQRMSTSDKRFEWLLGKIQDIDRSVNQTFNARDAYNNMQNRVLELEKALRDKK